MKLEDIKRYWNQAGKEFPEGGEVTPTSRDPYLGKLERENILDYLNSKQIVLDIGCGDASHSVYYARKVKHLLGIDIAPSLIKRAKARTCSERIRNVDFFTGSVLDMEKIFKLQKLDCIISQRCLINLAEWSYQKDVILKVHGLLKDRGPFLLTEGFQDELNNLNRVRRTVGLSEIKAVSYNRNFVREDFELFVKGFFDVLEIRHYGVYLFLTRLFHPLTVLPEKPKHDSKLNEVAMQISEAVQIPDLEKYSYNLFYVLKKK